MEKIMATKLSPIEEWAIRGMLSAGLELEEIKIALNKGPRSKQVENYIQTLGEEVNQDSLMQEWEGAINDAIKLLKNNGMNFDEAKQAVAGAIESMDLNNNVPEAKSIYDYLVKNSKQKKNLMVQRSGATIMTSASSAVGDTVKGKKENRKLSNVIFRQKG
jgi:DNA-binding transcriptional MerR regulator